MNRLVAALHVAVALLLSGCTAIDDLNVRVDDLENRVTDLEVLCGEMNANINSLKTIVDALQSNDYITHVTPIIVDRVEIGYTVYFLKADPITIYHGADGKDGLNGADGKDGTPGSDGKDGQDGADGSTPVIGVKMASDGRYYWTLNGSWLLDDDGNKIRASAIDGRDGEDGADGEDGNDGAPGADGKDGQDGKDGVDGKDGITPELKIEEGNWYISYDKGITWKYLGRAAGADGKDGQDGADGKDGKDGSDGDSFFIGVDYTSDPNWVIFSLADGSEIKLPTWRAYEELTALCNTMNANLQSLKTLVEALQERDYVIGVSPLMSGGEEIGYTITFLRSGTITIYHGKDGQDGGDGKDGESSEDGEDGKTPVIGVRMDSDGCYYWTLNGDWLLDDDGNKVRASGRDGADGKDGADGEDGITPKLKIENNYWYVSYDNGKSWSRLGTSIDPSVPSNECIFKEVTVSGSYVVFKLADGNSYAVPMKAPLSISFSCSDYSIVPMDSVFDVEYDVTCSADKVNVEVIGSTDLYTELIPDDSSYLSGKIRITTGSDMGRQSKIVVLVSDGCNIAMKSLVFEGEMLKITDNAYRDVSAEGEDITIEFLSNMEYSVEVSANAASWITPVETRSVITNALTFNVAENSGKKRTGTITVTSKKSGTSLVYTIAQRGWVTVAIPENSGVMPYSGYLHVDSEPSNDTNGVENIVDNDRSTYYETEASKVTMIWESSQVFAIGVIDAYFKSFNGKGVQHLHFSASQDRKNWDMIMGVETSGYFTTYHKDPFPSSTKYKYFKITAIGAAGSDKIAIGEFHLMASEDSGDDGGGDDGGDDDSGGDDTVSFDSFEDVVANATHFTASSSTPMGNHYADKHVTTDEDRVWLSTASNEPALLPSASSYALRNYPVNLYPFGDPVPADVNQHGIGDCSALAVFASMAYLFPDFIKSIITDNGDGTFVVDMYDPQGKPVEVAITSLFLGTANGIGAASGKVGEATWATVLEKAIMKWNYIYQVNPDIWGIGSEHVAPLFTGEGNSFAYYPGTLEPSDMAKVAKLSLDNGMIVIGGFNVGGLYVGSGQTVTAHAYSFMYSTDSSALFSMRNPWGYSPGTDGKEDGILNIKDDGTVPSTIDMRIIYPGAAADYLKTPLAPYVPPVW